MNSRVIKWPAEQIKFLPIEKLLPYANNPRMHPPDQIAQIARSIGEFGWTMPVLVDEDGNIIAGHGRVAAAKQMGLAEVPTVMAMGWSEAQRRAYMIADNQLTLSGDWNLELLRGEMLALKDVDFDLSLTGFDDAGLAGLLDVLPQGAADPDEAPAAPQVPTNRPGDCWLLGRHRLVCGDSTAAVAVSAALGGVSPHLMVTDPPYGVDYDPRWRSSLDSIDRATGSVDNDNRSDWNDVWRSFAGSVIYVWYASLDLTVPAGLIDAGFELKSQIIWKKPMFAIGRGDYHWQHETCLYAVRKNKNHSWNGSRKESSVWEIDNNTFQRSQKSLDDMRTKHGTQKPVECMRRPIENNSSPGQAVYDPFVGSGTTIIAAEMTGRSCHAIELSPVYVDVSVMRWQNFTEKKATLDGDGRSFDEIVAARAKEAA